jgi:hypothetical protein
MNNTVMENNPLTPLQIQQRIEAPSECKQLVIGGITMRYAWVSQRGYYPDGEAASLFLVLRISQ